MRRFKSEAHLKRVLTKSSRGVFERKKTEEDILGEIRTFLESRGALVMRHIERVPKCYHCGQWLGTSEAGIPDLLCVVGGNMVFIEVKRPGGHRRPKQVECIARLTRAGIKAFFAESVADVKMELWGEK